MRWSLEEFRLWALQQGRVAKFDDNKYSGECVSLINQYCYRVLDVPAKAWGHAKDWASNAAPLAHFDKVSGRVEAGDILVYPATGNNTYGHIEIALPNGQAIGQNRLFDYRIRQAGMLSGYIAVLRKKGTSQGGAMATITKAEATVLKNVMRVLNSEAKGWDRNAVHSGKNDEKEIDYLAGMGVNAAEAIARYSQQAWDEGGSYRALKDKWKAAYEAQPALLKRVEDLTKQLAAVKPADPASSEAEKKLQTIKSAAKTLVDELGLK